MLKLIGKHHGHVLCLLLQQSEALPLPGEWFIGVEILRKSVLIPIQYPLDTGQWLEALFPMNTKEKPPYRKINHLPSNSSAVDIDDQRWESTMKWRDSFFTDLQNKDCYACNNLCDRR